MKKISFILSLLLLTNSITAFAFDEQSYISKRTELANLLNDCRKMGLNCEYQEKSLNIFDYNISYIKNNIENNASEELIAYKESAMQGIYESTKAELEEMKSSGKSKDKAVNYETGDFNIDGRKILNKNGKPVFSIGTGNSNPSGIVSELNNIGFENLQIEWGASYVISEDNVVDSWIPNMTNTENTFAVQENERLHISNNSENTLMLSQTVLTKPKEEYILTFNATGNTEGLSVLVGNSEEKISAANNTVTFVSDDYTLDLCFRSKGVTDAYIDDVSVIKKDENRNLIINGDFSGDGYEKFDVCFNKVKAKAVLKTLDCSVEKNMSINLLLSPHYFPEFLKEGIEYGPLGFYDYIIDSPVAMEALKAYIYAIMPYVTEYQSLTSICLSNEPQYNTALAEDVYKDAFINFLKDVHGDNVSSFYGDVTKVSMPQSVESTSLFYDWRNFNNKVFADWHKQLATWVKDKAPQMPVHAKVMNAVGPVRSYLQSGIDMELFDEFCDILGHDSSTYLERDVETSFIRTLMWYDYLRSISDKPVYNSEEHITMDSSTDFNRQMPDHFKSVLWQGAIHGRNISSIWLWHGSLTGSLSGHIKMRPDCTEAAIHTSLDLNRLAEEVYAFGDKIPDAAILYSNASDIYSATYSESLYDYYKSLIFSGKTVRLVTDRHPEKMHSSDILLIPEAKNVNRKTLEEIRKFADSGKKIIIIGSDSLKYNEYNQAHNSTDVSYIKNKAKIFTKKSFAGYEWGATISDIQQEASKNNEYSVIDAATGKLAMDIEWQVTVSDGRVLMNLYYIADEFERTKTVYIKKGEEIIQSPKELISDTVLESRFEIKSREPKLIELGTSSANHVENLMIDENFCISWDYMTANEHKTKIYKVGQDGSLSWVSDAYGDFYEPDFDEPTTYMVVAQNNTGALSSGKAVTVGLGADFTVIDTEKTTINQENGLCKIYIENPLDCPVARKITVTAKDKDTGKIKKMAVFEKVLLSGTNDEFTCGVFAENTTIEITEN